MAITWWRNLVLRRMTAAASRGGRRVLAFEPLEDRTTPTGIIAVGAAAGSAATVTVFDAVTRQQKFTVTAFDGFTGGVNVAVGDVNGDGTADVIAGAGPGGGSDVKVFSGVDGTPIGTRTIGDAGSRAGTSVAAADFDGDGKADLVVGTILNGVPVVQVVRFADAQVLHTFTPFGGTAAPSVAVGDYNGDGRMDVFVGAGAGGGPQVLVFDGTTEAQLLSKFAFEETFTGGVQVSAGDLTGDGKAELIAAAGNLGGPRVVVFGGGSGNPLLSFYAYDSAARRGVAAVATDSDGNGKLDVVTADGAGTAGNLKAFDPTTLSTLATPLFPGLPAMASYDTTAPTATLVSTSPATARSGPFAMTATFSEPVNGFTADGLAVTNGTVANFTAVDAKTYTFDLNPTTSNVAATVQIKAGAAADVAGNGNTASNTLSRTADTTGPTTTVNALTTNDTTPTITGTVSESGSSVVVSVSGPNGASGPLTATVSGTSWSVTVPTALADGTYDVTATGTDAAGNAGAATTRTGALVIDTARPTASVASSAPEPTKTSPIPFTVTFSQAVTLTAAGVTVTNGTVTNFAGGGTDYSFGVVPTGQGLVTVSVADGAAKDAAGNGNTASNTVTRTFDNIAPAVTANSLTTNDTTPTVTGTINDNGATIVVALKQGGTTVQSKTATQNAGTWSIVFDALPAGTYDIVVTATDAAGNVGNAAPATLVIDTTDPVVTATPLTTNDTTPTLTGTIDDPTATISVEVKQGGTTIQTKPATQTSGTWSATFDALPAGTYDVTVTATDPAGNIGTADLTGGLVIDATAPAVTADQVVTNNTKPTLTGTVDDPNATVSVTVGGQTLTAAVNPTPVSANTYVWSATATTDLAPGVYDVAVTATDTAGNVGNATGTGALLIDTANPDVAVNPSGTAGMITGTASDADSGVSLVEVAIADQTTHKYWSGTAFALMSPQYFPVTDTSGGGHYATWSYSFNQTGTFDVTARATDAAGNENTSVQAVSLTAASTEVTADPLTTNDTTPTLTGTVNDPAAEVTVTATGPNGSSGPVLATVSGTTWSATLLAPLPEGTYDIVVSGTAAAGAGGTTLSHGLVIDTTAPIADVDTQTTRDTTPTITGTVDDPIATVTVIVGTETVTATVNSTEVSPGVYAWSATLTTPLGDGTYDVTVDAADPAGNTFSKTVGGALIVDTTAPTAVVPTQTTKDSPPTVSGTVDDPNATVTVTVGTETVTATVTGTSWTATLTTPLTTGEYNVTVDTADPLGNTRTSTTTDTPLVVDVNPPTVIIDQAPDTAGTVSGTAGDVGTGVQSVELTIVDGNGHYWDGTAFVATPTTVTPDDTSAGQDFSTWSYTFAGPAGSYTVTATVTDGAGNVTTQTDTVATS